MPNVFVAINMDNGAVAVMEFVTASRGPALPHGAVRGERDHWTREPTDENIFAELLRAFPARDQAGAPLPQPVSYKIVAKESIPVDRFYRNALRFDGTDFHFDVAQAKEMHRAKLRSRRAAKLTELDGEWMKAFAAGDTARVATIEAERQRLRDAPQDSRIDAAETIDALKSIWPADLPRG